MFDREGLSAGSSWELISARSGSVRREAETDRARLENPAKRRMLHLLAIVGWVGPQPRSHRAARAPLKSPGSRTGGSGGARSPGDGSSVSVALAFARLSQVVLRLEEAENDAFLSGAWRGGPMQFSAAVEASALREGAYSWSIERIKDSQGAYAWSKDVVLQAQSLGRQRLQSLGLLPEWLRRASVAVDEDVEAGGAQSGDGGVWVLLLLVAWACESLGPASLVLSVAGAAAAAAGAAGTLPLRARPLASALAALEPRSTAAVALKTLGAWVVGEALFYVVCCAVARAASRARAPCSFASSPRRRLLWRRILNDPSQPPQAFVTGWMYRRRAVVSLSPPALLLRWAWRRLAPEWAQARPKPRVGSGAAAVAPGAAAAPEPAAGAAGAGAGVGKADGEVAAAEPPVVESLGVPYAELSVGDVYCWLAGNLYGRAAREELTPQEDA